MKIIIVGLGKVGATLASQLNEEGNDIIIIDEDAAKVKALSSKYDVMGVIGNGATREVQKEAGVDSADLLIAVTGSDELNLLCCLFAKKSGNCQTIARIKSPEYSTDAAYIKNELGLAMVINPEYAAAQEIARILNFPSAIKIDTFAKGKVEILKVKLPEGSSLVGKSVRDIVTKLRCNVLICTVERDGDVFIPKGDFIFEENDLISIVSSPRSAVSFFKKIGYNIQPAKNVIIVGGGNISHYLCEMLEHEGVHAKVIEKNKEICAVLSEKFRRTTIIHGDATDEATMREEGIATTDAFVALGGIDEENILLSLFARNEGSQKIITKINRIEYNDVIDRLDLGSIIYPKHITADLILRYVRARKNRHGSNMETLYNIIKGKVEAIEFSIGSSSPLIGKTIAELEVNENVIIAAILRGRSVIIPRGQDSFSAGDSVVIVTKDLTLHNLTDALKK